MSKLPFNPIDALIPISLDNLHERYNLDGYLTYSMNEDGVTADSYVQLFRNGIFETVDSWLLNSEDMKIPSVSFEEDVMKIFKEQVPKLNSLNVGLPIFAFLTFVGVKGYSLTEKPVRLKKYTIERDVLLLPEIVIESFDFEVEKILKPWFDVIWNACGFPYSYNFDDSGKWIGRSRY